MLIRNIPRSIRFLVVVVAINVLVFSLCRVGFWWYFKTPGDTVSTQTISQAFLVGFKFDLRLAILMVLPVLLLFWSRFTSLLSRKEGAPSTALRVRQWIALGYLTLVFAFVLLVYIFHFGYYSYLGIPLDATILRFLKNAHTSLLMVWESYHVIWIVLGWLLIVAIYALVLSKLLGFFMRRPMAMVRRRYQFAMVSVTGFLVILGLLGKWSLYPLRWSDAFFSQDPFVAALAVNPVLYSYDTMKIKNDTFDTAKAKKAYDKMADYLGVDKPDKEHLNYKREGHPNPYNVQMRPNVVLVFLESFASYKTGLQNNPLNPTPYFDDIAHNAIYFDNYYTPHTGTARSVFTALTGLPDIERHTTSSRNPLIVNQHTIINAFKGYNKMYFIGGSTTWGNIRGVLTHNIPNLQIHEEGSYTSPTVDVWGISDLSLFKEANKVFRKEKKPFIAVIQTSGNHRPYTIPDDHGDFKISPLKDKDVKDHGFASVKEFNSFRFMDYCVGAFIAEAKKERYFDKTIFVFYGDHGIHAPTGNHVPKYEEQLRLQGLRTPLVMYAPNLLPRGLVIHRIASEVDMLPTVAGLATNGYINTTLGRDILDDRFKDKRYAFTAYDSVKMQLGLLGPKFYFEMYTDGSDPSLHELNDTNALANVMDKYPEVAKKYKELTRDIYETDRYMRFHNADKTASSAEEKEASVADKGATKHD